MELRIHVGLVIVSCIVALGIAFAQAVEAKDSVVTEVRINDEGIRVGSKKLKAEEGVAGSNRVRVISEDVVRFGDDIIIEEDEVVEGDAVAILGNLVVNGGVEGDAVAIGGSITVGPVGEIDGDAVGIGGGVTKDKGGIIRGEMVSIGKGPRFRPRHPFSWAGNIFSQGARLFFFIMWTVLLVLLGLVILAVVKKPVDVVSERARKETFKMGLIGLLAEVLVLPVMALFIITIVGIPIGAIVIPLVLSLALLMGYVAVSLAVGERVGNGEAKSPYVNVAVGIAALQALAIVGGILRLPGGSIGLVGTILSIIGWAIIYVAATVGLGSVIMSKFGTKALVPKTVELKTEGTTGTSAGS